MDFFQTKMSNKHNDRIPRTLFHLDRAHEIRSLHFIITITKSGTCASGLVVAVGWFMVLNATFNNISVISWISVLFVEETVVTGENHRPVASH
jgi:hypothetical protein